LRLACARGTLTGVATTCLIIDDSTEFLASATRLLESQGVQVVGSATTGLEAIELAEALAPDVDQGDVELGQEDGVGLGGRLLARVRSMAVVLISSHDQDDLTELIAGSGAAGFIAKGDLSAAAIAELVG
jgi:DNA-binding NarL/FixJ family response regulator